MELQEILYSEGGLFTDSPFEGVGGLCNLVKMMVSILRKN